MSVYDAKRRISAGNGLAEFRRTLERWEWEVQCFDCNTVFRIRNADGPLHCPRCQTKIVENER